MGFNGQITKKLGLPSRSLVWEDRHGSYRCFSEDCSGIKTGYSDPSEWKYYQDECYLGYYNPFFPDWRPEAVPCDWGCIIIMLYPLAVTTDYG